MKNSPYGKFDVSIGHYIIDVVENLGYYLVFTHTYYVLDFRVTKLRGHIIVENVDGA